MPQPALRVVGFEKQAGYGFAMKSPEIPRHLGTLTADWLDQALRREGVIAGPKIERFEIEKLGEGAGFMGETARLRLFCEGEAESSPASVVVKIPTEVRKLRAAGEALGVYEREIYFYSQLASRMPVRLPRCHFGAMDDRPFGSPEKDTESLAALERAPRWVFAVIVFLGPWLTRLSRRRYVLILEDLAPARLGDQVTETSEKDIQGALTSLARIHAECWNDPKVKGLPWIHPVDSAPRMNTYLLGRGRRHFEATFDRDLPKDSAVLLDWLEGNQAEIQARLSRPPCTLIHGDYRLDNLFFDDSTGDGLAIVSDWQVPSWGRGVCDLAYFLSGTLDAGLSMEDAYPYVDAYHAQIESFRGGEYTQQECRNDYRLALFLVLGRVVSSFGEIEIKNERAASLFHVWVERAFARLRGVDLSSLL